MSAYKIEKNIPMPSLTESSKGRQPKYPFRKMKIKDSFLVPGKTTKDMSATAAYYQRKYGTVYTLRTVKDGVRIWRVG